VRARILVVDDEEVLCRLFTERLRPGGVSGDDGQERP
jgi:CheY-like chemotaxis protein